MMLGKHFMHPKYICSYAQPREWKNLIRAKSIEQGWGSLLGFGREAVFLDRIKKAYDRSRQPASQPASLWIQRLQRRSLTGNLLGEELSALLLMQALVLDLVLLILTRIGIGGTGCQLIWSKLKEITYFGPGLTYQDPSIKWFKIAKQSRIWLIKCNNVSTVTDKLEYHPINFWRQHLFIFIENVKSVNHIYSVYCICGCPTWFGILI